MLGNSRVAAQLAASQEGLNSMSESISCLNHIAVTFVYTALLRQMLNKDSFYHNTKPPSLIILYNVARLFCTATCRVSGYPRQVIKVDAA
jgi:hypothetical protein